MLSAFSLIYMLCLSGIKSLWYDDIYQIYFTWERSFSESMKLISSVDLNPPLWAVFTFFWQKIAPFGTTWLRLPSMLFVWGGIFFTGLCAKRLFGEKTAIVAAILCSFHAGVAITCGYSYRSYGALFFSSALLIYAFVRRYFAPTLPNRLLFLLSVFLIGFTHYFGALLCIFLAICDFILCLKGKQKKTFIIEYAIVGICELPWLLFQLSNITSTLGNFWTSKPSFYDLIDLFRQLMLNSYVLLVLFGILAVTTIVELIRYFKTRHTEEASDSFLFRNIFLFVPLVFILFIFFYSQLSSRTSLWVDRYFYHLIPLVILFVSATLVKFFDILSTHWLKLKWQKLVANICLFAILLGALVPTYMIAIRKEVDDEYEPFEQAAELVMSQPEITSGERVLVFNTTPCASGWDYYLGHKNSRDMSNVKLVGLLDYTNDLAASYDTVILYAVHFDGTFDEKAIIHELEETHSLEIINAHYDLCNVTLYKFTKNK